MPAADAPPARLIPGTARRPSPGRPEETRPVSDSPPAPALSGAGWRGGAGEGGRGGADLVEGGGVGAAMIRMRLPLSTDPVLVEVGWLAG